MMRLLFLFTTLSMTLVPWGGMKAGEVAEPFDAHAKLEATLSAAPTAGGEIELRVRVVCEPGFHIYSANAKGFGTPTLFEWGGKGYEPVGAIVEPLPHRVDDPAVGEPQYVHEGTVTFSHRIKILDTNALSLVIKFTGQVCNDAGCFPLELGFKNVGLAPALVPFHGTYEDLKTTAPPPPSPSVVHVVPETQPVTPAVMVQPAPEGGLWSAFLAGALGGLLAIFTPCVFPMIPITLSYFLKQAGQDRAHQLKLAGVYAAGVVVFFTLLGVGLTLVLGHDGPNWMATNPWINLSIGAVFFLFALSFLGAFELRPPSFLMSAAAAGRKGGYVGALIMGLTFAVTSFTCTFPVVGSQLALTAGSGDLAAPIVTMLGFSGLIGALFFGLALFPAMASSMPKSGGWLGVVKVSLGFAELALALKFFRVADIHWQWGFLSRDMVLVLWVAIHLVAALFLLGLFTIGHNGGSAIGVGRLMTGLSALAFSIYLSCGLLGASLASDIEGFLLSDPPEYHGFRVTRLSGEAAQAEAAVLTDYDEALKKAAALRKPLFVDFSGRNCSNCRKMEAGVFPRSKDLLSHFVEVRLMTDEGTEISKRWHDLEYEKYKDISLPFYALETPEGIPLATAKGLMSLEDFRAFLQKGIGK